MKNPATLRRVQPECKRLNDRSAPLRVDAHRFAG
ncbi:hypothetical protein OR37_01381 [Caulobacter vibrioides OR37]|jgi:hypothetical protein|uniref:Uncharacterized protein n=1 Tax=Caulobacter vibrioides OR37 TaxID=1292034 RepID=R0EBG1_CAUVI|nr:hypothetical protein OR37_01381 [Caulobacter vibrioides OR37]